MEDDSKSKKKWLDRLSDALLAEPQNTDQLRHILSDAADRDIIQTDALHMIEGVLQVANLQVRDVMVSRAQMVSLHDSDTVHSALPTMTEAQHSRYPVLDETGEKVLGILLAKDLLPYLIDHQLQHEKKIADLLRDPVHVPESKRLDVLLKDFRETRQHMAIVVNEFGDVAGLVTIEDVLEQIVGDIADEYDEHKETDYQVVNETTTRIDALMPIESFNEYFQRSIVTEEFDTIGGYIAHQFGYLPKMGESVEIDGVRFEILRASNKRIVEILVNAIPIEPTNN